MPDLLPEIKDICRLLEIKPKRSKGQNFLVTEKIYDDIVAAAGISAGDTVLEIGPGLGFLTLKLAKIAKKVIAVELDDQLAEYLSAGINASGRENIEIVNQDILKFDLGKHLAPAEDYKIVANLPYNITSIFLRNFLSAEHKPLSLTLMLQKEVAERMVAEAPDMSLLALSVQYYSEPHIVRPVKAGNFWPEPQVDSAVIHLALRPASIFGDDFEGARDLSFFRLARIGFSAKRKMLKNNLAGGLKIAAAEAARRLQEAGLPPAVRAEDLSLDDWRKLFAAFFDLVV